MLLYLFYTSYEVRTVLYSALLQKEPKVPHHTHCQKLLWSVVHCLKKHQQKQEYPVRVVVWIFKLPEVFETYVRHRDVPPAKDTVRVRGGSHNGWSLAMTASHNGWSLAEGLHVEAEP